MIVNYQRQGEAPQEKNKVSYPPHHKRKTQSTYVNENMFSNTYKTELKAK